jgi:DNA-directed RNA polymerase specialized sigma24 family protein
LRRQFAITEQSFDSLLAWFDSNRESAGRKYELIRSGLIRIFVSKGFSDAEDLADETINRVTVRLPEIRNGYVGEPARYFHGVARNIILETRRRKEVPSDVILERASPTTNTSEEYGCLTDCLKLLPPEKRELILDYHLYRGHAKIEHHKVMADELSITEGALRTRAHHMRVSLEKCVLQCIQESRREQNISARP